MNWWMDFFHIRNAIMDAQLIILTLIQCTFQILHPSKTFISEKRTICFTVLLPFCDVLLTDKRTFMDWQCSHITDLQLCYSILSFLDKLTSPMMSLSNEDSCCYNYIFILPCQNAFKYLGYLFSTEYLVWAFHEWLQYLFSQCLC